MQLRQVFGAFFFFFPLFLISRFQKEREKKKKTRYRTPTLINYRIPPQPLLTQRPAPLRPTSPSPLGRTPPPAKASTSGPGPYRRPHTSPRPGALVISSICPPPPGPRFALGPPSPPPSAPPRPGARTASPFLCSYWRARLWFPASESIKMRALIHSCRPASACAG